MIIEDNDNKDVDMYYEEQAEKAAEIRWKRKITNLYYDLCYIDDRDPWMKAFNYDMKIRLNKFFRDELSKTI